MSLTVETVAQAQRNHIVLALLTERKRRRHRRWALAAVGCAAAMVALCFVMLATGSLWVLLAVAVCGLASWVCSKLATANHDACLRYAEIAGAQRRILKAESVSQVEMEEQQALAAFKRLGIE